MTDKLDPEMAAALAHEAAGNAGLPPPADLAEERARGKAAAAFWNEGLPKVGSVESHRTAGGVPLGLFKPVGEGPFPTVLYIHGGGWVLGSVVQNEPVIRTLVTRSGWAVLAPTYRLAPEHPYPAGLDDVTATLAWLTAEGAANGLDPRRIVLAGTSAGANLALAAALAGKERALAGLLLFYGVYGADLDTESYRRFGDGRFGLSKDRVAGFFAQYDPAGRRETDPLIQPLLADLAGLPPTWLLAAGLDVLLDDTLALHARLVRAEVPTTLRYEPGVVHGFINRGRMVGAARRSLAAAASFLSTLASDNP